MVAEELSWRERERSSTRYRPWRRSAEIEDVSLYWLPVSGYPVRSTEKVWISHFLLRLQQRLKQQLGLRMEHFLQLKSLYPLLIDSFTLHSQRLMPFPGLSRRPDQAIVKPPSKEQLQRMLSGGPVPPFEEMVSDLCYWLLKPDVTLIHDLFLGSGGLTQLWLPPSRVQPPASPFNKKIRSHPAFKDLDIDGTLRMTYALADPFQAASKELFGSDLKNEPTIQGLPFIIPLLHSADVLRVPAETRAAWSSFMPVYINESKEDVGLVLMANREADTAIFEVLLDIDAAGIVYPWGDSLAGKRKGSCRSSTVF